MAPETSRPFPPSETSELVPPSEASELAALRKEVEELRERLATNNSVKSNPAPDSVSPSIQAASDEELKRLALRHELSLRASGIGIWDWDLPSGGLLWDSQMYQLYGINPEDFTSAYDAWLKGLHPEDRAPQDLLVQRVLAGEQEFNTEFRVIWPNGNERTIRAIATVVRGAEGEALRMLGVNWDVTDVKQREAELQAIAGELSEKNRELEQFSYFVSHDLRAPIRHISAFAEMLVVKHDSSLDDESRLWLGYLRDGADSMDRLVADLLAYSRAGKLSLQLTQVDLNQVVDALPPVLNSGDPPAQITVEREQLPTVTASQTHVEQLFQNLMQNAQRYAKPGKPSLVKISGEETKTHWRICLKDDGIGIAPEFQSKVFEPFERAGNIDGGGSGIGLAICHKIVRLYGGDISVESDVNDGAAFFFSFRKV